MLQNRGGAAKAAPLPGIAILQLLPGSSSWDSASACSVLATGISRNSHCHLPAVTNPLLHCDTSRSLRDPPGQGSEDPLPQVTALQFEKSCESLSRGHKPRRSNYVCYTQCQCLKVKLLLLGCPCVLMVLQLPPWAGHCKGNLQPPLEQGGEEDSVPASY